jgi:Flp pilus assembly protein TadG
MLKMMNISHAVAVPNQRGAAAVEFAIIAMLLFTLLFGIFEFGRLFYVLNSVQEVTRRAAREAVVRWTDAEDKDDAKELALFGGTSLPAGAEITGARISIDYLDIDGVQLTSLPTSPGDNITKMSE